MRLNGVWHDDYMMRELDAEHSFPYVHTHLFYIFLEIMKNSARASIERARRKGALGAESDKAARIDERDIPDLQITVPEGARWDEERSVKLADAGIGMNR